MEIVMNFLHTSFSNLNVLLIFHDIFGCHKFWSRDEFYVHCRKKNENSQYGN